MKNLLFALVMFLFCGSALSQTAYVYYELGEPASIYKNVDFIKSDGQGHIFIVTPDEVAFVEDFFMITIEP